ncbi:MAG: polysaccharide biosynthesis/export family protein [Pyrinomonadaceae bacterium]
MKNSIFAAILVVGLALAGYAQVNPAISVAHQPVAKSATYRPDQAQDAAKTTRARVLNQTQKTQLINLSSVTDQTLQAHAKANFKNRARLESLRSETSESNDSRLRSVSPGIVVTTKAATPPNGTASAASLNAKPTASLVTASQIYRVGVGDVLDIQLNNNPSQLSTLFTVRAGGMLEYPLAGNPVQVTGMTTVEIATTLRQKIKFFEDPVVEVNVRDYASHTVTISGFVAAPGIKALRREAVPLYTLLAESLVLSDAARVSITRSSETIRIDLKDPNLSATLVFPGDVIKVLGTPPAPAEFFFVAGQVKLPGQKAYHSGLTLTQAILAAGGGMERAGERVRVSRQGVDGRLVTTEFNLRKIQDGKIADPAIQKDDRIEVGAQD